MDVILASIISFLVGVAAAYFYARRKFGKAEFELGVNR